MGVVYAARDERLGRAVAVKTLSSLRDETARKRFWREARAAASVSHPNVCQIYEIGEDQGELFIAMELLEGESLADLLQRGPAERVACGVDRPRDAVGAVGAARTRDHPPRPQAVERVRHGTRRQAARLRPGEARAREPAQTVTAITQAGMLIGTPRYMAPELVTGEGADARSDLFAAGAILFEMLAGRPAFAGRTVVDVLRATTSDSPPALGGSPAVAAVDRVIRRALAKRPGERLPSADVMADELRAAAALDTDSVTARAQTMTQARGAAVPDPAPRL